MAQTSYVEQPVAFEGMLADSSRTKHADSMVQAQSGTTEIPFGVVVALEAAPSADGTPAKATMPDNAADKLWGIVLHSHDYDTRTELGTTGLKPKTALSVLRKGRVYVKVENAVAAGDRGHVRYASGAGGTQLGAIRNAAVTNETIDATGQIIFITSASAGGLAIAEVDFTNEP